MTEREGDEIYSQFMTGKGLENLVKEVDPNEQLDEDVKNMLLVLADDMLNHMVSDACRVAKHRKSKTLTVADVKFALERNWNIHIPGFGTDEPPAPKKKVIPTQQHQQNVGLIKKTLKKI